MPKTTVINKGDIGYDLTRLTDAHKAFFLREKARLAALGKRLFLFRYLAVQGVDTTIDKGATDADNAWCVANAIPIGFIKENSANDIQRGAPGGAVLATRAKTEASAFKPAPYPDNCGIIMCADTYVGAQNLAVAIEFFDAAVPILAPHPEGCYGNFRLASTLEQRRGAPCNPVTIAGAVSWSRDFFNKFRAGLPFGATVHMVQTFPPKGAPDCDQLVVTQPFVLWNNQPDPPAGPPRYTFHPTADPKSWLSYGAKGPLVEDVQRALVAHGLNVAVDGRFGRQTRAAVKAFQKAHRLTVDGRVGAQTWAVLGS